MNPSILYFISCAFRRILIYIFAMSAHFYGLGLDIATFASMSAAAPRDDCLDALEDD